MLQVLQVLQRPQPQRPKPQRINLNVINLNLNLIYMDMLDMDMVNMDMVDMDMNMVDMDMDMVDICLERLARIISRTYLDSLVLFCIFRAKHPWPIHIQILCNYDDVCISGSCFLKRLFIPPNLDMRKRNTSGNIECATNGILHLTLVVNLWNVRAPLLKELKYAKPPKLQHWLTCHFEGDNQSKKMCVRLCVCPLLTVIILADPM